jgi:eukaryotic-like serine/threonine-protein kinase
MTSVSESQIGHYKILSQIGAGGMGKVYLAEDTRLERKVAVKLLKEEYTKNEERMNRFILEAKTASSLNHPNIIVIHEIGEDNGTKFISAEYIEGETLRERFVRGRLSLEEILGVSVQIAEALSVAHKAKIIHRDIKPENIMIRPDGYVKVLDFGLAKLAEQDDETYGSDVATQKLVQTNPGVVMGSAAYMSPEQARGAADIDERTDIFSLGIVMYEMLAGRLPFYGETLSEVIAAVIYKDAESVAFYCENCPPELERIVMKALEKDRDERYQVVKDLALDLKSFKRRLEFEAELERNFRNSKSGASGRTTDEQSAPTAVITTSGVHKDAILLTEFENLTGDPVFDNTLKMALAAALEQSPFLNIFPENQARQTLPLMGLAPDTRITKEIGREICERKNLKAFIAGTISNLGSIYVIALEAVNARTDEVFGRQFEQAESKEQVLKVLGQAATKMRRKLGESLSSIGQFDTPLEEATTGSLDALKHYSYAQELQFSGKTIEAIPFYKKAIEFDPNFATVYLTLGVAYANTNQWKLATEIVSKAFALRNAVSEWEKLQISYFYYAYVTGEVDKQIETLELWKKTYPKRTFASINLASCYERIGQSEKAVSIAREGLQVDSTNAIMYMNLAESLLSLSRYEEVKEICREAFAKGFDGDYFHLFLYIIAFIETDAETMREHLEWFRGRSDEYLALDLQTGTAAFQGQWRNTQESARRAINLANLNDAKEVAAQYVAEQALRIVFWSAASGLPPAGDERLKSVLKNQTNNVLRFGQSRQTISLIALALALAGLENEARAFAERLENEYPKNTLINQLWLPTICAALALQKGKAKEAVEELEAAERFEKAAEFYPQYIRALAYMKLKKEKKAVKEFEKILNNRGEAPLSAIYPLALLGRARATKNKKDYEEFFRLWNEADNDMPALVAARKEFDELSGAE